MSAQDRVRWDAIYRQRSLQPFPPPDPLLFDYTPPVMADNGAVISRHALDLAAGFGQNGLWLAAQGYTVDVMDISRVALSRTRAEMGMRNLRSINLLQVDLDNLRLEAARYDLVCVFRYLKRRIMPQIRDTVKPGGRIIYETFNMTYLNVVPDFNVKFLLNPGELAGYFPGWQVLHDVESGHVSQFVAVKPPDAAPIEDEAAVLPPDDDPFNW